MYILSRNQSRLMVGFALGLVFCPLFAYSQSESGADFGITFSGEVRYQNNTPAQFVQVELWTDGEASWRTITTTDRMGRFHVGAPCMVVQYKIETPGYLPLWGRVDMSTQPCHAHEWITLKPKGDSGGVSKEGPASGVIDGRIAAIPPEAKTEFYQHDQNWSNRMILGDSLQVMASLAEREGLRGQVQCIYLDPPYGIKFNSNFQWSTTSRDVKDGNADHITREPEQVKAFRDTWRDGIHSYLTYLRDRLTLARDLLTDSGSMFVQISFVISSEKTAVPSPCAAA